MTGVGDYDAFYCAVVAGHGVGYVAAFKCGTGWAGRGVKPVAIAGDDFGVSANINEHDHIVFFIDADGQQVGSDIGADMGSDQRAAVDVGVGVDADAQFVCLDVDGSGVSLAVDELGLDVRLVGFLPDRLDVDAEEHVAHSGIADGYELDDLATSNLEGAHHLSDLVVDTGDQDGLKLATEGAGLV